jgi:death-on-curing protein
VKFLSAEQVIEMHAALLEHWGGEVGASHRGPDYEGVEAAVQAVKNSYYETAQELAAAYAVYLVQGHPFVDGNKRTGAAAMLTFLFANGHKARISPIAAFRAMLAMQKRAAAGERTDALIAWLAGQL